jgi:hypothetical protein
MIVVKPLLIGGLLALSLAATAAGGGAPGSVSVAGISLRVPSGWYGAVSVRGDCDPERLAVVSSSRASLGVSGRVLPPARGQVVITLLEDRFRQDRPSGDLRRPAHFSVAWDRLVHVKPICGAPDAPAFLRAFREQRRYFVFIVYPGGAVSRSLQAQTLGVLDSFRVK